MRQPTAEVPAPPPEQREKDTVQAVMLLNVRHAEAADRFPFDYIRGQSYPLPRALAATWALLGWAEAVALSRADLVAGAPAALAWLEQARTNRGATTDSFYNVPANRRVLSRIESMIGEAE